MAKETKDLSARNAKIMLHWVNGLSVADISEKLKLTKAIVYKFLYKSGVDFKLYKGRKSKRDVQLEKRNQKIVELAQKKVLVREIAEHLKTSTERVYFVLKQNNVKPTAPRTKKKKYVSTLSPSHLEWLKMAIREEIPIVKICRQLGHSYGKIIKEINLLHEIDYTKKQKWEKNGFFDVDEFGKLYRP